MTIESVISSIHEAGFRVLNLFEREDGLWQANVRDDEKVWEFGVDPSPELALEKALQETKTTKGTSSLRGKFLPNTTLDELF